MKANAMLLLLASTFAIGASAQDFPQTDEDGQTIYYKIISAYPEYATRGLCLQDNTQSKTGYPYVLLEEDATQTRQEWVLLTASVADCTYHLRCHASYRYVSTSGTWMDGFYVHTYSTRKVGTDALTVRPIGTGNQVTISFEDSDGERRLAATDMSRELPTVSGSLADTPWAWYIVPVSELTGINVPSAFYQEAVTPKVFDILGRRVEGDLLHPGIYIVNGRKVVR